MANEDTNLKVQQVLMSLISSGSSGADIFFSVQEREAVNAI
jgi:hypothetical protein